MNIIVYSRDKCPNCDSAKRLLETKGLPYSEIKLECEDDIKAFYEKCGAGVRQMPQIFIDEQRVGGLLGLQAALQQLQGDKHD